MLYILLGATGDLSRKKIMPALARLAEEDPSLEVVASSRRPWSDKEYQEFIEPALRAAGAGSIDAFLPRVRYVRADFTEPASLAALAQEAVEGAAIQLAIEPGTYMAVIGALGSAGAFKHPATRLLIEKPFGGDGASALALEDAIEAYLPEERIYRIDHYLGKPCIRQAALWREQHGVPQALAKGQVRSMRVAIAEPESVEGRGAFYDATGVIRDVVQNHALMSFSALLAPKAGDAAMRLAELKKLSLVQPLEQSMRQGQYAGYGEVAGVAQGSKTATAVELQLSYAGVGGTIPLTLYAGKGLAHHEQSIRLELPSGEAMFSLAGGDAYATLIQEALAGDRSYFPTLPEVLAAWRLLDPVIKASATLPLSTYEMGEDF